MIQVLLIEPDSGAAARLRQSVGNGEFHVETAGTDAACSRAGGGGIDAVLVRLSSPVDDVVQRLCEAAPEAAVIALTDDEDPTLGQIALRAGAEDAIPVSLADRELLHETIRRSLKRHRAEIQLRETLSRLEATLESTNDGILVVDRSGRWVNFNQNFARMWHLSPEVLAAGDDERAITSVLEQLRDPESFATRIRELYSTPEAESQDVLQFRDGRIFERFSKPQRVGGTVVGRVWSFRDVTARERAEQMLREREERYESVFRGSLDPITVTRFADGCLVDVNDAFLETTGYSRDEVLGRRIADLGLWAIEPERFADGRRRLEAGEAIRNFEATLRMKDGSLCATLLSATRIEIDGETHILTFARDISDRKKNEEQLREALGRAEQSEHLKMAFLANMSHEIRTPLNVILGYASLVSEHLEESGDASQRPVVEGLQRAGQRLLETIHGILDISRIESGAFDLNPVELDLSRVVEQQVRECRILAEQKGIRIECRLPPEPVRVRFDEYCLSQAVLNLLGNAIKFTSRGGITVRTSCAGDGSPVLEIADTGIGIDAAFLPRLFEPFVQESAGYTRSFDGSGLGLALTKRYVEMNGGTITVRSEKGAGSTFRIHFARGG